MSLEFWSTVASIATFFVIAATAAAALVQLRHMRASNQIAALSEISRQIDSNRAPCSSGSDDPCASKP